MIVNAISSIMIESKQRKWANKNKNLMTWEVSIILLSILIATVIVSILPEPIHHVRIGRQDFISFEAILGIFPNCVHFILSIFTSIGQFFINIFNNIKLFLFRLFSYNRFIWNMITFIPIKIGNFLYFLLISFANFLTNICIIISTFFDFVGFYISFPFKYFCIFFNTLGLYIEKLYFFIVNLPGISHLIHLFRIIIHDIIIIFTSLFVGITRFGEFIGYYLESFDFNFDILLLNLRNFRFFKLFVNMLRFPLFVMDGISWCFNMFVISFSRFLKCLHLYDGLRLILGNFYNIIFKFALYITNIIIWLVLHIHSLIIQIPRVCNWFNLHLNKIEIRFVSIDCLRGLISFLINIVKWIFLFPAFILRRFIGFLYYILGSLSFTGLENWWNNLCQDQAGGCQNVEKTLHDFENQLKLMRTLLEKLKEQQ
ncbi:hypothetical protein TRFO_37901 [Tritrichomonas foetus]|uniref:Transmembrane protein n=1 Tax=Tritrichomonas foetus TaxID=1144522 RepID=A0A1J4JBB4_9EUKA|nr:hypothetical protein TRFO_37901 [Tritrichomonas foetus]|eukprot:OHS95961.1 hypothetical protein TRFO_37901 [Tritrichomonas foetus]